MKARFEAKTRGGKNIAKITDYFSNRLLYPFVGYIVYPNGFKTTMMAWTKNGRLIMDKETENDLVLKEEK